MRPIAIAILLAALSGCGDDDDGSDGATGDSSGGRRDPTTCCVLCENTSCSEACGCNSAEVASLPAKSSVMSSTDAILFAVQTDRTDPSTMQPVAYLVDFAPEPDQDPSLYCVLFAASPEGTRRILLEATQGGTESDPEESFTLSSYLDGQCVIEIETPDVQLTAGCNEGDRCVLSRAIGRDPAMIDVRCNRVMGHTPMGEEPVSLQQTIYLRGCAYRE